VKRQLCKKGLRSLLSANIQTAEKILSSLKGLRKQLQADEQPLFAVPAIWDNGRQRHSIPCDIVLTNQRLMGYYYVSFPRERLFLDALPLADITGVSLRQKAYEPLFRELLVSDGQRKVYIRAPRRKIEDLYSALRAAIESHAPSTEAAFADEAGDVESRPTPVYGRQEISRPFESSPLAIVLLFVGGLILEIVGVLLWMATQSAQVGLPLCVAGFAAVITSFLVRRNQR
jgi:hypothetical protein